MQQFVSVQPIRPACVAQAPRLREQTHPTKPSDRPADCNCGRGPWGAHSLRQGSQEPTMRRTFGLLTATLTLLAWTFSQLAVAQSDVDQQLGTVHFKTSCNEVAQRRFDRAMRYQHSYWYLPAKE